jgi:N-acetylglucosamine malate deacetylase 1
VSELPGSALVLAPHADDEAMGCSGLMARLSAAGARIHVIYGAVDGFHHYGIERETTLEERIGEIESVLSLFPGATYEIAYAGEDMIERLDSLPQRDLVDRFERALNDHEPQLLLLPAVPDYDQDHRAVHAAGLAAARPIAPVFGKWLVPHVLGYEMAKLQYTGEALPRFASFVDITDVIETKLESIRRYATMLRPVPHIRSLEAVEALAMVRGAEIGVRYAEAFGVVRTVLG